MFDVDVVHRSVVLVDPLLTVEPLEKGDGVIPTHYVWRHVLTVPKFLGMFEYKYIVRSLEYDANSTHPHKSLCRWEAGPNRVVDLKSVKEDILLKNDAAVHFPSLEVVAKAGMEDEAVGAVGEESRDSMNASSQHSANNLSLTQLNLSMDFLDGDDDLPPPSTTPTSPQPESPVGLSFLRPAPSPATGSPSRLTWGNDTSSASDVVSAVVSTEEDAEYQQKLLETAAENLLNSL